MRNGFHRATMHDVAAEAGMSPGNLYRYFPSKDAIVAGLAERDRAAVAEDFSGIDAAPDLMQAFAALAQRHLAEAPAEKAVLCLEMWAEATRNPAMAAICRTSSARSRRASPASTAGRKSGSIPRLPAPIRRRSPASPW